MQTKVKSHTRTKKGKGNTSVKSHSRKTRAGGDYDGEGVFGYGKPKTARPDWVNKFNSPENISKIASEHAKTKKAMRKSGKNTYANC